MTSFRGPGRSKVALTSAVEQQVVEGGVVASRVPEIVVASGLPGPADILGANLRRWFKTDALVVPSAPDVQTATDKAGSGDDANAPTVGQRPDLITDYVYFDPHAGTGDALRTTNGLFGGAINDTVVTWCVHRFTTLTPGICFVYSYNPGPIQLQYDGSQYAALATMGGGTFRNINTGVAADLDKHLLRQYVGDEVHTFQIDGTEYSVSAAGLTGVASAITQLGFCNSVIYNSYATDGDWWELVTGVWPPGVNPSNDVLDAMDAYMAAEHTLVIA